MIPVRGPGNMEPAWVSDQVMDNVIEFPRARCAQTIAPIEPSRGPV